MVGQREICFTFHLLWCDQHVLASKWEMKQLKKMRLEKSAPVQEYVSHLKSKHWWKKHAGQESCSKTRNFMLPNERKKSCQWFLLLFSCCVMSLSFATPWAIDHQSPLFMGFPIQENWSGLPFPSSGDLPDAAIEPMSPALEGRFVTTELPWKSCQWFEAT